MKDSIEHIFVLTNTLLKGGAEKQSILLTAALSTHFNCTLVVYYGEQCDSIFIELTKKHQLQVVYLHGGHLQKWLTLYRLFRKQKNTAVFSYLATTNVLNAVIGGLAGVRLKIAGVRSDRIVGMKLSIQKLLHNHVLDASVFNNYAGLKVMAGKGFKKEKSFVIHNCIEEQENKRQKSVRNEFVIVCLGRFVPEKDIPTAIEAFGLVKGMFNQALHNKNLRLCIIGYGPLETQLREMLHLAGLDGEVEMLINPPNVQELLLSADVFFSTSLHEGLSNSILEAMQCALPIVATNVGDNIHLVQEGENGFLTSTKDAMAMAKHLYFLATNEEKAWLMGQSSFQKTKEKFGTATFAANHMHLLEQLSESKKIASR